MISGKDLYKVLSAVVPLYVSMILAYGSLKWWKILTPAQCGGINRFVSVFAVPLLSFQFISGNDPYTMNFRFIAADAVSKISILIILGLWVRYTRRGSLDWMITIFMLATLPNTLVMGTPLLAAMYGAVPGSLTVQAVVLQCIIWYTLLLILYEYRAARLLIMEQFPENAASIVSFNVDSDVTSLDGREPVQAEAEIGDDGKLHVKLRRSVSARSQGLNSTMSSGRSLGLTSMPSSKALTPRPSNMSGAEIYSLHSSVNLTPRESSFNHNDFYSMMSGHDPRQSNFNSSDVYSIHSSRGPTPRSSNFAEEQSKDLHVYPNSGNIINSPRLAASTYHAGNGGHAFTVPRAPGGNGDAGHRAGMLGTPGTGVGGRTVYPGSNGTNGNPVYSPKISQITKKILDPRASPRMEDAKELHMFVWSSSASPCSEGGLHVFGGSDFGAGDLSSRRDYDPKEVRLLVLPSTEQPPSGAAPVSAQQTYEEYANDDFSFGNRGLFKGDDAQDKDDPSLNSKFGSTSTAELRPKEAEDGAKTSMPPSTVMFKLICVMTLRKLVRNPNTYSSLIGLVWSLVACRWNFKMPLLLHNSVHILSDAGLGMAMFSLGLFMGLQERIIVCGTPLAVFGMAIRFLTGPAAFAAASYLVGLRGVSLHVSIVQAALPQGIVPFVFAKEYNVHPDILSTAVIFGMLISLPITLIYYILLGL